MTALELPERVRRVVYYLAVITGGVVAVAGKVLDGQADAVAWFRGLSGLDSYLLATIGAVALSHMPGKAVTAAGDEVPLEEYAPATAAEIPQQQPLDDLDDGPLTPGD